MIKQMLVVEEN